MSSDAKTVICDNGIGFIKAQIVGSELETFFPNIVGDTRHSLLYPEYQDNQTYVGDMALSKIHMLDLTFPIRRGIIYDFEKMEKVWEHTFFKELEIEPSECNLIITEAATSPRSQTDAMVRLMFDKFEFHSILVARSPLLSMYAANHLTGIAVDIGDSLTQILPVYDGVAKYDCLSIEEFGGLDITDELMNFLESQSHDLITSHRRREINHIKETLPYVAQDYETESHNFQTKSYPLPDGNRIVLAEEAYKWAERFFWLNGLENYFHRKSITDLIADSIFNAELSFGRDISRIMRRNIVLGGGSTLFRGLAERITTELQYFLPLEETLKVHEGKGSRSTMIGGRMLALLPHFHENYLSTKDTFEEEGNFNDVYKKRI